MTPIRPVSEDHRHPDYSPRSAVLSILRDAGVDETIVAQVSDVLPVPVELEPNELAACPWCGEAAEMGEDNDPVYRWSVRAPHTHDCFLAYSNANRHRSYATEAEAIAAWNRRVP